MAGTVLFRDRTTNTSVCGPPQTPGALGIRNTIQAPCFKQKSPNSGSENTSDPRDWRKVPFSVRQGPTRLQENRPSHTPKSSASRRRWRPEPPRRAGGGGGVHQRPASGRPDGPRGLTPAAPGTGAGPARESWPLSLGDRGHSPGPPSRKPQTPLPEVRRAPLGVPVSMVRGRPPGRCKGLGCARVARESGSEPTLSLVNARVCLPRSTCRHPDVSPAPSPACVVLPACVLPHLLPAHVSTRTCAFLCKCSKCVRQSVTRASCSCCAAGCRGAGIPRALRGPCRRTKNQTDIVRVAGDAGGGDLQQEQSD